MYMGPVCVVPLNSPCQGLRSLFTYAIAPGAEKLRGQLTHQIFFGVPGPSGMKMGEIQKSSKSTQSSNKLINDRPTSSDLKKLENSCF